MTLKAKVTINRLSSQKNEGVMSILIEDPSSGLRIVEVHMEYAEYAQCTSGLGSCDADVKTIISAGNVAHLGKTMEFKEVFIEQPSRLLSDGEKKSFVYYGIQEAGYLNDGWYIHNNGTHTKQPSDVHKVILARYVDNEEEV